eukprot:scaffold2613_cov159-Ochromonas_danica.AAC.7
MALSVLSGHRDALLGVFFGNTADEAYTVARDGGLFAWQFDGELALAKKKQAIQEAKKETDNEETSEEDEDEEEDDNEEEDGDGGAFLTKADQLKLRTKAAMRQGNWKLLERRLLRDNQGEVTACSYNRTAQLLLLAFNQGVFALYEMPDCINLHRISVSSTSLDTTCISSSGEWLGMAGGAGQLLVWEWRAESFVLKQQGHLYGVNCLDYSPDGQFIASGGEDGKVKIWSTRSGFCQATFKEHLASITGLRFVGSGRGLALLSSSLDGSVRAHDMLRYKNFRTLTTPSPAQLTCLAADSSGEVVCAGSLDPFNIYVWALQTGKLLEVLSGHEGPIACLDFSPSRSMLASGSWDGTCKLWNIFSNECVETLEHGCDVLSVAFRPDGKEVCCATTNGNLTLWDALEGTQVRTIEGREDISGGRLTTDARSAKNSSRSKFFTTITYSADGSCLLAGGRSKYLCLYATESGTLVKKYQLSFNRSLEGIVDQLRSDRLVDGVSLDNLADKLAEDGGDLEGILGQQKRFRASANLPGAARRSSLVGVSRTTRPELLSSMVRFSPSGREWAVASTQGLQVYGLDDDLLFAPLDIDEAMSPQAVYGALDREDYVRALTMALHLGESSVLLPALVAVPQASIELVAKHLDRALLPSLFRFLADQISSSQQLGYLLHWAVGLLRLHGSYLLQTSRANLALAESLRSLLRACTLHEKEILRIAQDNLFSLSYLRGQMAEDKDLITSLTALKMEEELAAAQDEQEDEEDDEEDEEGLVMALENDDDDDEVPWTISTDPDGQWNAVWQDDEGDDAVEVEEEKEKTTKKKAGKAVEQKKVEEGGRSRKAKQKRSN